MEVVTDLITDGAKCHWTKMTPQPRGLFLQREEVRREKGKCVRGVCLWRGGGGGGGREEVRREKE